MKRKLVIVMIIVMILSTVNGIQRNIVFASEQEKNNENSYWSTKNAPIIYGATKITIKKGILDSFDVKDARFRVFAKDFEDGDLTDKIKYSGTVDTNTVGEYKITYTVQDSHNNITNLDVKVYVTDEEDAKINVERTLYTIPSMWNLDMIFVQ